MMKLGEKIRQLRDERGWSQDKLGQLVGASRQHICEIESGKSKPSLALMGKLAAALGKEVWVLEDDNVDLPPTLPPDIPTDLKQFLTEEGGIDFLRVGKAARGAGVTAKELIEYIKLRDKFKR